MPRITREQVLYTARLARLRLTDDEARAMTRHLEAILDYAAQLETVDTEGVEPMSHVMALETPLRSDAPQAGLSADDALANAPGSDGTHFLVPKILDSETQA